MTSESENRRLARLERVNEDDDLGRGMSDRYVVS